MKCQMKETPKREREREKMRDSIESLNVRTGKKQTSVRLLVLDVSARMHTRTRNRQ